MTRNQCHIDAATGAVNLCDREPARLPDGHDVTRPLRRRVAQRMQGCVTAHVVDRDIGAVGAVFRNGGFNLRAHRVGAEKLEKWHCLIDHRLGAVAAGAAAPLAARPAPTLGGFRRFVLLSGGTRLGPGPPRFGTAALTGLGRWGGVIALAFGVPGGPSTGRAADRGPAQEYPTDPGNGLASHETALVKEPGVLAMEFLEGVVGQNDGVDPVGDLQDERVTAANGSRRRRHQLGAGDGLIELGPFGLVDTVAEGGVDDHGEVPDVVLGDERLHCFVELGEARK